MINYSFSKLYQIRKCSGAATLPRLEEKNEYQEPGNERHDEWETDIKAGNVPAILEERWPGLTWQAEVSFAYDVATDTARFLGVGIKRDYARFNLGAFEICGTVDVLGMSERLIVVGDRKSFDPNIERAAVNAQVHAGALAACRTYGIDNAEVFIHHETRALDVEPLDALSLDTFAEELRGIVATTGKVQRGDEPAVFAPGSHCRWCSSFHSCPEQQRLTAMVVSGGADTRVEMLMPLGSDEGAAQAYEFSQRLGMLKKRLDAAIFARAAERPFAIGNGMMLGMVTAPGRDKLDADVVYGVMKAEHGQAIADCAVERTATKKKLKEALSMAVGKGAVAAAERSVLSKVRELGGIENKETTRVDTFPACDLCALTAQVHDLERPVAEMEGKK